MRKRGVVAVWRAAGDPAAHDQRGHRMLRTIVGVLVGVVAMFVVIMAIEAVGHLMYPPPPGLDPMNPAHEAAFAQFVATMPAVGKAMLALAWTLGAFTGGFVAARIAHHPRGAAVLIALLVMSGVVGMSLRVPHPSWLVAAGLLLPIPAAWLAARLARPRAVHPMDAPQQGGP